MTSDELVQIPSLEGTIQYEWGSDKYVEETIAQFPVEEYWMIIDESNNGRPIAEYMPEWWSWALHYTKGKFQPLIQAMILCSAIKAESGGVRNRKSAYVNAQGVREDSVGLFQMYRFGAGARFVPELNNGIDMRENPFIQFDHMVPNFNSNFITAWNEGYRGGQLAKYVCGRTEGSESKYWNGYTATWNTLTYYLPWRDYLIEGF